MINKEELEVGAIYSVAGGYYIVKLISIDDRCTTPDCTCRDSPAYRLKATVETVKKTDRRGREVGERWSYHGFRDKNLDWKLLQPPDEFSWLDVWEDS